MANKPKKPQKKSKKHPQAQIYSAKSLGLNKNELPHSIIEVVGTLIRAGFEAYIVGGGVRDSLLGLKPKDFDAVTNARPHEIKALFGSRCRIIGRRFQLAHVYSGREMIEVATFRAPPKDNNHTTVDGMIVRDNVWGDIHQDFARRDFSVNALYYQPIKAEVLDFCGAIKDIKSKTLRLLGDAKVRIEEDPVRLLRALRFKAKLGFEFDKSLNKQFCQENWTLLEQVSAHRLYDEAQKMFGGGYLASLLPLLFEYGAIDNLMTYAPDVPNALMTQVAINTDNRINQGKSINPAFFYATLLWENYLYTLAKYKKKGLPFHEAQTKAATKVMQVQRIKTAIPRFAEEFITDIWLLQPKLSNPRVREVNALARHAKFRAGFDFLAVREAYDDCALSESTNGMAQWWLSYQMADEPTKEEMIQNLGEDKTTGLSRRRRRRNGHETAELLQLQKLSMSEDGIEKTAPQPLFVPDNFIEPKKATPRKRDLMPIEAVLPVFERVDYTDDDFLKLLNNDEPYIPSVRYRKREPSSTLSVIEREKNSVDDLVAKPTQKQKKPKQSNKAKTSQSTLKTDEVSTQNKPKRRRRKANAKPKASEE